MGEVGAVAGAVTAIVGAAEKLAARQDEQNKNLDEAVADLRSPLPDPAPVAAFRLTPMLITATLDAVESAGLECINADPRTWRDRIDAALRSLKDALRMEL